MKFFLSLSIFLLGSLGSFSQSLGLQQLGSLGGENQQGLGPILIHSIGALASTEINQNNQRLDQGMFVPCDLKCSNIIDGIENQVYKYPLLNMYPNPTRELLQLDGEAGLIHHYELYSIMGKLVSKNQILDNKISLKNLAIGIYVLRIHNHKGELLFVGKVEKI